MKESRIHNEHIKRVFEVYKLLIVSLIEPYRHVYSLQGLKCKEPAGGLTAALDPLMKFYGGTWIASGTSDADWSMVDEKNRIHVPPDNPQYTLRRIKLSRTETRDFYYGFNHRTFWPLLHEVFHRPDFTEKFWDSYREANLSYARTLQEEIDKEEKSLVWFQDFQLTLVPRMLGKRLPEDHQTRYMQFMHTPWPSREAFIRCPWGEEILDGLLANKIIGFHLQRYAENFLNSVEELLEADVDFEEMYIDYEGKRTWIIHSPISVDFKKIDSSARKTKVEEEIDKLQGYQYVSENMIGLGIDRLDYAKGIPERLEAIDRFLEKYPHYQENFLFIQAGAPILSRVPDYRRLSQEVQTMVDKINTKYEKNGWRPIWFIEEKVDVETLRALQRIADVYIVSSLHDGLNLVSKENISADVEKDGVLLLSKFAGAAEELQEAIKINPFDTEEFADLIQEALEMPAQKKRRKMEALRETVSNHTIYDWLSDVFETSKEFIHEF